MRRLAGFLIAAAAATPGGAQPLVLTPDGPPPKLAPAEAVMTMRPIAAGPYRPRVVVDLDQDESIDDLGPLGSGKDGIIMLGFASLEHASPWEWLRGYDLNRDGRVAKDDSAFEQVRVWIDADGDLVPRPAEMHRPEKVGIDAIVLPHGDTDVGSYENAEGRVFLAGVQGY